MGAARLGNLLRLLGTRLGQQSYRLALTQYAPRPANCILPPAWRRLEARCFAKLQRGLAPLGDVAAQGPRGSSPSPRASRKLEDHCRAPPSCRVPHALAEALL